MFIALCSKRPCRSAPVLRLGGMDGLALGRERPGSCVHIRAWTTPAISKLARGLAGLFKERGSRFLVPTTQGSVDGFRQRFLRLSGTSVLLGDALLEFPNQCHER